MKTCFNVHKSGMILRYGHKLLCSDGKIRGGCLGPQPDTYFSIPASIKLNKKTITGYATTDKVNDTTVYIFRQHNNQSDLPDWPNSFSNEYHSLLKKAI